MRLRSLAVVASVVSLSVAQAAMSTAAPKNSDDLKITICHRTNSMSNPYVTITVDKSAADGSGGKGDHYAVHTGSVWTPDSRKGEWGDIIPPIPGVHAGRNWTIEGQAIWNNGCVPLSAAWVPPGKDSDGDKIPDTEDSDDDNDNIPDTVDTDDDGDKVEDVFEPDPEDVDGDNTPDAEDPDDDNDNIPDTVDTDDDGDNTPDSNETPEPAPSPEDADGDNTPDAGDPDDDNDGVDDAHDPDDDGDGVVDNDAPDQDDDNIPDIIDNDDDGDDIPDNRDRDKDNDNVPNKSDSDDDGDDIPDTRDPSNPSTEVLVEDEEAADDADEWDEVVEIDPGRPDGTGRATISVKIRCTKGGKPSAKVCDAKLVGKVVRVRAACAAGPVAKLHVTARANNARPSKVVKTIKLGNRKASAAGEVSPQACKS